MTWRERKQRWREELKHPGISPTWTAARLNVNIPINDYAFVPADEYQPRHHEATIVTQHQPHTPAEPATHTLLNAIVKADDATTKRLAKYGIPKPKPQPDARWLQNNKPTTGRIVKNVPVDWTNWETTRHYDLFTCKHCRTSTFGTLLDSGRVDQHCPHKC
jgi:hypothetical protein